VEERCMADLVYVVVIVGFFVLCVAYVIGLDHIVGPDPEDLAESFDPDEAGAERRADVGAQR
jgi:hypothetical protein